MGTSPMKNKGVTNRNLIDCTKTEVFTLLDTGPAKPMLNKEFLDKILLLHTKYKVNHRDVEWQTITSSELKNVLKVLIEFSGHVFTMIVNLIDGFIFVFVANRFEADVSVKRLRTEFTERSIDLHSVKDFDIPPGKFPLMKSTMRGSPSLFKDGQVIAKFERHKPGSMPQIYSVIVTKKFNLPESEKVKL